MKNNILYIFLISVMLCSSCKIDNIECIRASSNIVTESRDLRDYRGIVVNLVGDILITQGPEYSFKISGPDNVVELTTTRVENELLIVGSENCFNGSYDVGIEITAPEFEVISLTGIGNLETAGVITGEIIEVELIGINDIEAEFMADTLFTEVAGTGTVVYSGEVSKHSLLNAGDILLNAFSLNTKETVIDIIGVGDSQVTVSDLLDVTISGSGTVFYRGNPQIVSSISGNGEIIDSN